MSKQPTSVRLPDLTLRQLAKLITSTGMTQSEIFATAIDRMYQQETQTMSARNPTYSEIFEMAKAVYDAANPDRDGERNPEKLAEIEEWLSGPGGWADYATPESLAVEWRMVEAEAERATS